MRRIISKHEEEKKRKRNLMIIGVILIFVMFGSVFGIIVGSFGQRRADSNIEYNGYEFFNQNGLWHTSGEDVNFAFIYHPIQTKNIETTLNPLNNYYNKPLYIYSEDSNSEIEIYRNLGQFAERVQKACFSSEKCEENYPTKTCSDNFIIIEESPEQEITQSENCVYIRGSKEELLELTDEFLFNVMGIK